MRWSALTHQLYKQWGALDLQNRRLLVLLSGGADSVACLLWLAGLPKKKRPFIVVLHCHHGVTQDSELKKFRDDSARFCQKLCKKLGIKIFISQANENLSSEAAQRDFRREQALKVLNKLSLDFIVTGHHADDLVETQLFRIMRGTGLQGLRSISKQKGNYWRPLLSISKQQILEELKFREASFCKDPSNLDLRYDRNWIRHELLPMMNARRQGAVLNIANFFISIEKLNNKRSIRQLNEFIKVDSSKNCLSIDHSMYLTWTSNQRQRAIAACFLALSIRGYTRNHILEVFKQLDKVKKGHSFVVCGCIWRIERDLITLQMII